MRVSHYSQDVNITEHGGLLCQFPSVPPVMGKAEGPISHIFNSIPPQSHLQLGGCCLEDNTKQKRNTFCVISEPHLLVVITKAYVPGFYIHITSIIIWFCTSIHVSHPRPSDALQKTNKKWQEAVQYIFTTLKRVETH